MDTDKYTSFIALVAGIALLVLLLYWSINFSRLEIEPGYVGISACKDNHGEVLMPGSHYFKIADCSVFLLNAGAQAVLYAADSELGHIDKDHLASDYHTPIVFFLPDGRIVRVSSLVSFRVIPERAMRLVMEYGVDYVATLINPTIQAVVREALLQIDYSSQSSNVAP